jgi:PAS domain S-box-containing protein
VKNQTNRKRESVEGVKTLYEFLAESERPETNQKGLEEPAGETEEWFRRMVEIMPDACWMVSADLAKLLYVSPAYERIYGRKRKDLYKNPRLWLDVIHPEDRERVFAKIARLDGEEFEIEYRIVRPDGSVRSVRDRAYPVRSDSGEAHGIIGFVEDITDFKQAEQVLEKSEAHYRLLAENVRDVIWTLDMDLHYTYVSPSVTRLRGYSVEEVMGQTIEDVLTPPSLEVARGVFRESLARGCTGRENHNKSQTLELELKCKDGSTVWTEVKVDFLRDKDRNPLGILGVTRDISGRKQAEEALCQSEKKLRFLSSHLLTAQETERKRMSLELHDGLGQALIGLKYSLRSIERRLRRDQTKLKQECEQTLRYIDKIVEDIRRLSRDLTPSLLEDLGLSAALRCMVEDFAKQCQVKALVDVPHMDDLFPEKAQIILYRIFQEALTNIAKHAAAAQISVAIEKEDGSVSLRVEDDGKGFNPKQARMRKGMGLTAMEERAWMLGGSLEVSSQEGKGTRIRVTIPTDMGGG